LFPFKEKKLKENKVARIFNDNVDSDELIWHRDKEHRIVKVVKGTGWGLQLDNEMPFVMEEGKNYVIPKEEWHRVIKGNGDLIVEITKILD